MQKGIPILRFPDAASFDRLWQSDLVKVDRQTDSEKETVTHRLVIDAQIIQKLVADYGASLEFGHKKHVTPYSIGLFPYGGRKRFESFCAENGLAFEDRL